MARGAEGAQLAAGARGVKGSSGRAAWMRAFPTRAFTRTEASTCTEPGDTRDPQRPW